MARVGNAYLAQEEVTSAIGADLSADRQRLAQEYVDSWITSQLLYQEAVREGVGEDDEVKQQIEQMRQRLIIGKYLTKVVYTDDASSIDEAEIKKRFDSESADFVLREDIVQISAVLFSERDAANAFRTPILSGSSWGETLSKFQNDPVQRLQIVQVIDHQYFSKSALYPEELWKLARTLPIGQTSFAVKTDLGYYVMQVYTLKKQGELPPLEYVRDEIRQRIILGKRKEAYELLLQNLRTKTSVEVVTDFADTAHSTKQ